VRSYVVVAALALALSGCVSQEEKETVRLLTSVSGYVGYPGSGSPVAAPRADGGDTDPTGQEALRAAFRASKSFQRRRRADPEVADAFAFIDGKTLRDGWGNPLQYRCPNPNDQHTWILFSCGPDGLPGTPDDLGAEGPAVGPEKPTAVREGDVEVK
jgi:hypothetical protein